MLKKDRDVIQMLEDGLKPGHPLAPPETIQRLVHDLMLKVAEQQEVIDSMTAQYKRDLEEQARVMAKNKRLF